MVRWVVYATVDTIQHFFHQHQSSACSIDGGFNPYTWLAQLARVVLKKYRAAAVERGAFLTMQCLKVGAACMVTASGCWRSQAIIRGVRHSVRWTWIAILSLLHVLIPFLQRVLYMYIYYIHVCVYIYWLHTASLI